MTQEPLQKKGLNVFKDIPFHHLVAYYPLCIGSGSVAYEVMGCRDGDITAGTWIEGDFSNALEFDGTSSTVNISGGIPDVTDEFTLVWWASHYTPNDGDEDTDVFFRNNNYMYGADVGNRNYYFWIRDTAAGEWVPLKADGVLPDDYPAMKTVRFDGTNAELLIDRRPEDSGTVEATGAGGGNCALGYRPDIGGSYFDGFIEGVMVFDKWLSDETLWRIQRRKARFTTLPFLSRSGGEILGHINWDSGISSETADSMTADPEADTEDGYIEVEIEGTVYQVPVYSP